MSKRNYDDWIQTYLTLVKDRTEAPMSKPLPPPKKEDDLKVKLKWIDKVAFRQPNDGCWIWQRAISDNYYGKIKNKYAHRVIYELFKDKIPDDLQLDHKCEVKFCVNPDHLEPVTQQINLLRGKTIVAEKAKQITCIRGHKLSITTRNGETKRRTCSTCSNARRRAKLRRLTIDEFLSL